MARSRPAHQTRSVGSRKQGSTLFGCEPISKLHADPFSARYTMNTRGQFRAQQSRISGLECETPDGSQAEVYGRSGEVAILQFNAVPQNHCSAEGEPWLRAIPGDKIIDRELVCPRGLRGAKRVEHGAFGVVEIGKAQGPLGGLLLSLGSFFHGSGLYPLPHGGRRQGRSGTQAVAAGLDCPVSR